MGFTVGFQEALKRGERPLMAASRPAKTRDLDPSSYFPNSFRGGLLGNRASGIDSLQYPLAEPVRPGLRYPEGGVFVIIPHRAFPLAGDTGGPSGSCGSCRRLLAVGAVALTEEYRARRWMI